MVDLHDVERALSSSDEWVRDEMAFIADMAAGLGCDSVPEAGPGLAYRVGRRKIGHAHPKRTHIGIGLPERMRSDVAELTDALRAQKGLAWFNYQPGVVDRDTVALLFELSRDTDSEASVAAAEEQRSGGGGLVGNDDADLRLILAVLTAFREHELVTGRASSLKPLRETVFFRWEGPRLPRGKTRSPLLPHSPAARAQRAQSGVKNLVYEHVTPISVVLRRLLLDPPSNTDALRRVLDATAERVIITMDEDRALTAAGYRDAAPDSADPWSRYGALSLSKSDFTPYAT